MSTSRPSLGLSLLPIVVLVMLLAADVLAFGEDSSYGSNQIALLLASGLAVAIGMRRGQQWSLFEQKIKDTLGDAVGAILILLLIGALAGTWLVSGIIPTLIDVGLDVLSKEVFLPAACILCAAVSLATGSSWGTVGTVGVALIGIGQALGLSEGWIAGAIISGAYFGDKLSPLSDTTNLAPTVAGTDLFTHIRFMLWTTVPSILIALTVFTFAGLGSGDESADLGRAAVMQAELARHFNLHWALFLVPVGVIVLIARRVAPVPALFLGVLGGAVAAAIAQPELLATLAEDAIGPALGLGPTRLGTAFSALMSAAALDTTIETGNPVVTDLLSAGGMKGMLNTVWLIICALTFGAVMGAAGFLERITQAILTAVHGTFSLVFGTAFSSIVFNIIAADQYIAIVVPGRMFREAYQQRGVAPQVLSRTLEDAGTVTSVLIPWNTCGVAQSGVLGVGVLAFAPYCVFNYVSPIMTLLVAAIGFRIPPAAPEAEGQVD
ncbi:MAG: Na+/H+ antiporter NhaC [Flavobacteriales bacterium]|nr:Na+/H+ antiporter NhaC [Flavobacteriales bacterium]